MMRFLLMRRERPGLNARAAANASGGSTHIRRTRVALAALAAFAACAAGAPSRVSAQGDAVRAVVRRADRAALIVLFDVGLKDAATPRSTADIRLFDAKESRAIPLAPQTAVSPARCPQPEAGPENRLCIELAQGERLDHGKTYVLVLPDLPREGAGDALEPGVVTIPPVGGAVSVDEDTPGNQVHITYSLDVTDRPQLEPRILVDGQPARITTLRRSDGPPLPLCYNRGSMRFICNVNRTVKSGQRVTVTLADGARPATVGEIEPATPKYDPADAEDARVVGKGSLARTDGESEWSVQVRAQNWPWISLGGPSARQTTTIGPLVDVTATSDDEDPGSLNFGLQARSLVFPRWLHVVDFRTTSRSESDKKTTVTNWMWADANVRVGVPRLYRGRLPGRGYYSLVPQAGLEIGRTMQEDSAVVRPEDDQPLRLKAGATAVLAWPNTIVKAPTWLPLHGVRVDAEIRQYRLQSAADGVTDRTPDVFRNLQLTWELSPVMGTPAGWRAGALPPLFAASRVFDLGLSAVY